MKRSLKLKIFALAGFMAVLCFAATKGNLEWTQLRTDNRQGTGLKGFSTTGTFTSGNYVKTDGSGNAVDGGGVAVTGSSLTANLPVFGNGSSSVIVGTRSGNTTEVMSATGAFVSGNLVKTDINGNAIDAGVIAPTTNQGIRTLTAGFGSFESGATALSSGATVCVPTYAAGTIQAIEIVLNASGSVTLDIQKVAHGSWTGTSSTSTILPSPISLSSVTSYTDTTLTSVSTTVASGSDFCFVMTSPTVLKGMTVAVKIGAN